jgi:hypothetical protein
VVPQVGEEVVAAMLSAHRVAPVSSLVGGLAMVGSREGPSAMERRMRVMQQVAGKD